MLFHRFIGFGIALTLIFGLSSCKSTHELSDADRNQFVTEFYAYVHNVHQVEFESDAEEAALSWVYGEP